MGKCKVNPTFECLDVCTNRCARKIFIPVVDKKEKYCYSCGIPLGEDYTVGNYCSWCAADVGLVESEEKN